MNSFTKVSKYALKVITFKFIFVLVGTLALVSLGLNFVDLYPYFIIIVVLDFQRPLVLKNYFILYLCLLFFIGGDFFYPLETYIARDGFLFLFAFLLGYEIYRITARYFPPGASNIVPVNNAFGLSKIALLIRLVVLFFIFRLTLSIIDIFQYGVTNFFTGGGLVDKIDSYGKENFSKGLLDIVNNLIGVTHVMLTILYVSYCLRSGKRINFWLVSLTFLVLPLLSLSRSGFAFGAISTVLIYSISLRNAGRITKKMAMTSLISISSLFFISVYIGGIRENRITSGDGGQLGLIASISGELSPIIAYNNLHEKIEDLNYQFGSTIIPPLIFKVIPRSWYPDKPINSTAYYSMRYDRTNFESGFMIPSTIFGDLFLNFGTAFSLFIILVFGFWIASLDNSYIKGKVSKIHIYIIVYTGFYGLIRNNLPEGMFSIIQCFVIYFLMDAIINTFLFKIGSRSKQIETQNLQLR